MIAVARVLVVAHTLLFIAATLVGLFHHKEATQSGLFAVIGLEFAGLCVIASWSKKSEQKGEQQPQ